MMMDGTARVDEPKLKIFAVICYPLGGEPFLSDGGALGRRAPPIESVPSIFTASQVYDYGPLDTCSAIKAAPPLVACPPLSRLVLKGNASTAKSGQWVGHHDAPAFSWTSRDKSSGFAGGGRV